MCLLSAFDAWGSQKRSHHQRGLLFFCPDLEYVAKSSKKERPSKLYDSLVLVCHRKESRSHFSKDVRAEIYGKLRPGVPVGAASWAQPEFKMFSIFFQIFSKCIQKVFSREELPLDAKQLRARRLEGSIRREASKNHYKSQMQWTKKNIYLSRLLGSRVTWSLPCNILHSEILEHANTLLLECCQASSPVPKLPVLGLQVWRRCLQKIVLEWKDVKASKYLCSVWVCEWLWVHLSFSGWIIVTSDYVNHNWGFSRGILRKWLHFGNLDLSALQFAQNVLNSELARDQTLCRACFHLVFAMKYVCQMNLSWLLNVLYHFPWSGYFDQEFTVALSCLEVWDCWESLQYKPTTQSPKAAFNSEPLDDYLSCFPVTTSGMICSQVLLFA